MRVLNVHEREFPVASARLGELLDSLASPGDGLWPRHSWLAMEFDRPLGVGADGGHGPIRYSVEEYRPGESVRFRFRGPKGFDGVHFFEVVASDEERSKLRHTQNRDEDSWNGGSVVVFDDSAVARFSD